MRIFKTPYRLSLFGGGTDYPTWLENNPGYVIGGAINKYSYILAKEVEPVHNYKYRIIYREIEEVNSVDEIKHKAIRLALQNSNIDKGLEIAHISDMPSCCGLGSSSSFTVGLIKSLSKSHMWDWILAKAAIRFEQEIMKENVGSQDQIFCAMGGRSNIFSIKFSQGTIGEFTVSPLFLHNSCLSELESHILLFYTKQNRIASNIVKSYDLAGKEGGLKELLKEAPLVEKAILNSDWKYVGSQIGRSWEIKKSLSPLVSNEYIDSMYETAIRNGAYGGKLIGAGGGGMLLIFAHPDTHKKIKEKIKMPYITIKFPGIGSCEVTQRDAALYY